MHFSSQCGWRLELRQQFYLGFCIGSKSPAHCLSKVEYIYRGRPMWWRNCVAEFFRQLKKLKERPPRIVWSYERCEEALDRLLHHDDILVPSEISDFNAGKYFGRQALIRFPHGESHLERGLPEIVCTLRGYYSLTEVELDEISSFVQSCDLFSSLLSSDLADWLKTWADLA